jgi:hypothetical protein
MQTRGPAPESLAVHPPHAASGRPRHNRGDRFDVQPGSYNEFPGGANDTWCSWLTPDGERYATPRHYVRSLEREGDDGYDYGFA